MTDAEKAVQLAEKLKGRSDVTKIQVGKVVIYLNQQEQRSDEYDLRVVKL